ncbi:hypothetical protein OCU04_006155 [Sclerotinia nivalis]|uniref:Zn(2)-C6 fungal-type domain-containing protein n=1 Tax=Sclerotinia nivalis TaxID=352851 RepID=A0A9X0AME9_9HELO|nr:hypothetical protein OCU04_006155 [Sclerotinia nivalis]
MDELPAQVSGVSTHDDRNIISKKFPRQAACLNCRRSKTRCIRGPANMNCQRCRQNDTECLVPDFHAGRRKGVKNKRSGLDKAVHQLEKAIKSTKNHNVPKEEGRRLQRLLSEAENLVSGGNEDPSAQSSGQPGPRNTLNNERLETSDTSLFSAHESTGQIETDDVALDDAENPLQLLARASDLADAAAKQRCMPTSLAKTGELRRFFGPFQPRLDVGSDIDPVNIGLVTEEEVTMLIEYFYADLSHTRWGLDPSIHTADFVRSRSAFLLTSMLAASALFIPLGAALSKRLSNHSKYLAQHVISKRFRSPEIVLAFMVNIPWMSPEKHWAEDETCSYMALAHSIALDVSLNKIIISNANSLQTAVPKSDCIRARKALDMDGFVDVDPTTRWGQKLLRRRERIWLALFNLDRGVCLARGRAFTVQISLFVETCDAWHNADIADTWDGSIVASSVLRRDIAKIITSIKDTCDNTASTGLEGYGIAQSLRQRVDEFFNHWYSTWTTEIGQDKDLRLPPYVEILVSHTRLAIYSNVLNYPTQTSAISHFFRSAGLSSALNVMRAAVQGEPLLKSMPNNTAIMVSFSACFALSLSTMTAKNNPGLRESIKVLIEETATVLERIGNITPHRKGSSALYGRHLKEILRNSVALRKPVPYDLSVLNGEQAGSNTAQEGQGRGLEPGFFEPLQFSTMSDDQIVEFFDNEEATLGISPTNLQLGDTTGMEWLDWFDFYETAEG